MLSKQECPHTGIVNYFTRTDPFVSVGSIIKRGEQEAEYHWRWYVAKDAISGIAKDMRTAEERLQRQYREQAAHHRSRSICE